jgi:hypothetical protein
LISDPQRVRQFESQARRHIELNYSWDKAVVDTETVYREAIARR